MNCPICGREMPEKAKKCGNCGCRPKYLYGRPPMPKWVKGVALAVLGAAVLTALLVVIIPRLPKDVPTEPSAPTGSEALPEQKTERWRIYLRQSAVSPYSTTNYSYDDNGNLTDVSQISTPLSSQSSSNTTFSYDENGVFTGFEFRLTSGGGYSGQVSYDMEQRRVIITILNSKSRYTFQYDEQNRLSSILYDYNLHTIDGLRIDAQDRWDLSYDDNGSLDTYTIWYNWYKQDTNEFVKHRTYVMKYSAGRMLDSYTETYNAENFSKKITCSSDRMGNVLSEFDRRERQENKYTYIEKKVSDRTAWQYELQLHLLYLRDLGTGKVPLPIIKIPWS